MVPRERHLPAQPALDTRRTRRRVDWGGSSGSLFSHSRPLRLTLGPLPGLVTGVLWKELVNVIPVQQRNLLNMRRRFLVS